MSQDIRLMSAQDLDGLNEQARPGGERAVAGEEPGKAGRNTSRQKSSASLRHSRDTH